MDYREKEFVLAHILRLPILFQEAKAILKPSHFDFTDSHYATVWQAALNVADKNAGSLPVDGARIRIELEAKSLIETGQFPVDPNTETQLFSEDGFFKWAYDLPFDWLSEIDGRSLLSFFLEERLVIAPFKQLSVDLGEHIPTDIAALFKNIQDSYLRVKSVGSNPVESAFPDEWSPKPLLKYPTNVPFLDSAMGGGQAPGEMFTLVGSTGAGKTSLGIQIATQGSLLQHVLCPEDPGCWFFFTYESPVDPDIRSRVWSHAAGIHRDTLETMRSFDDLSKADSLKSYEVEKYYEQINAGIKPAGEYERLMAVKDRLSKNLFLVDMSGSNPENPKVGCGGPEEIATILKKFAASGKRITGFVIDYAGIAVDRFMQDKGLSDEYKRHYLARYVDNCRRNIAAPFNASGWVLHQLSGAANTKSATTKQHHADAAECKTFSDNAWFAFSLGTKDQQTSTCRISCTKTRRSAGDTKERIIFIDGAFCTMLPGDKDYVMDIKSKRIIPRDMSEKIMSGISVKKPKINPGAI